MLAVIIIIADVVLAAVLVLMARQLFRAFRKFSPPRHTPAAGSRENLPSVTVCVPARNEQHALTDCLAHILTSSYPKLEVIVLDDSSADNTSALIKSFASEGVRFVEGGTLPSGWLGKNHALQGLLEEASGTYLLFVDVDTLLSPAAIDNIIHYALDEDAAMVSVLPRREDGWRMSVLFSPLRYFWELLFHRRLWPATSSNAWLIRRTVFEGRFDGFAALKNTVQPEAKIAAELAADGQYRYLISTKAFGVAYQKKWSSQLNTSIRLLFPLLGGQTALSVLAALDLAMLLIPALTLLVSVFVPLPSLLVAVTAVIGLGYGLLYGLYARRVWSKGWFVGVLLFPVIILQELCLIIASIVQHKRRTVTWKGRLIRPEVRN